MNGPDEPRDNDRRHARARRPAGRKIWRLIWGGCIILAVSASSGVTASTDRTIREPKKNTDFALRQAVERDQVTPVRVIIRVGKAPGQRDLVT